MRETTRTRTMEEEERRNETGGCESAWVGVGGSRGAYRRGPLIDSVNPFFHRGGCSH